ncbi:unnamed protein product [Callosobruchus maculatus]|uniref:Uncharacterized protein n=1 Tax=Callosobruchus maculatus TaxID=64391 RepID=A0A653BJ68_CALMS|nr:unnamed protein product [Callosobruchus maculatus]
MFRSTTLISKQVTRPTLRPNLQVHRILAALLIGSKKRVRLNDLLYGHLRGLSNPKQEQLAHRVQQAIRDRIPKAVTQQILRAACQVKPGVEKSETSRSPLWRDKMAYITECGISSTPANYFKSITFQNQSAFSTDHPTIVQNY